MSAALPAVDLVDRYAAGNLLAVASLTVLTRKDAG